MIKLLSKKNKQKKKKFKNIKKKKKKKHINIFFFFKIWLKNIMGIKNNRIMNLNGLFIGKPIVRTVINSKNVLNIIFV